MSAKSETDDLQKNLLSIFLKKLPQVRKNVLTVKEEWFSSEERRYLFSKIVQTFKNTKSLYTRTLFDFDINNEIDPTLHINYIECWNYIDKRNVIENSDSLILKLKDYENKQKTYSLITTSVESLQGGGSNINDTVKSLRSELSKINIDSEDIPIASFKEYGDIEAIIMNKRNEPLKYKGLKTGFTKFDNIVGGLFAAELTLFAAVTGVGKSTIMKQVGANVIMDGKNVLHITNEENLAQVKLKYQSLLTEVEYNKLKNPEKLSDEELEKWRTRMQELSVRQGLGELIIKEIPQFTDATLIEQAFADCNNRGIKIDLIIIDYLDQMKPIQQAYNENDEQAKITADVKGLAISCNVPVVSATQASTIAEEKQERNKKFGKYDVYGSKRKVHATNTLIFVVQTGRDTDQCKEYGKGGTREEHECDWFWSVEIAKNRDGPNFSFACRQHVLIGKVETMQPQAADAEGKKVMENLNKAATKEIASIINGEEVGELNIDVPATQEEPDGNSEKLGVLNTNIAKILMKSKDQTGV